MTTEVLVMKTIYRAAHLLTVDRENRTIDDGAVLVDETGRIEAVGPAEDLIKANAAVPIVPLKQHVLMPGLINTHCHSGLLRGTAEGLPVWQWLQEFIDPMHRVLLPEDAKAASQLCYAEALLSGTTTIVDMWRYMEGSAQAAVDLGIRAVLVPYVAEHPDHDFFETLDANEKLIREWNGRNDNNVLVWVGLEHLLYAVPAALRRAVEMSHRYNTGLHTHSSENRVEPQAMIERFGVPPIFALRQAGILDAKRVLLAHCVWLTDDEIRLMAERGIGVAHNPVSNMKLASGIAPVEKLVAAGIAVGLGTDGEKENNNLDLFEEMKVASLLGKLNKLNAAALDAWTILRMATINGARAIGLDEEIGSLEVGKRADMIAVRTDTPRMTPCVSVGRFANLHHNLVHGVRGGDVDLTVVNGRVVVEHGQLVSGVLADAIAKVNTLAPPLFERRARYLAENPHKIKRVISGD
jgi:5-methylthioadenosine/S-adenosylhomocysteine deaminase